MKRRRLRRLLLTPCRTPDALHAWVRLFTGLDVPRTPVCEGHDAPFDYLKAAYFEPAGDLVVWAPRGGGKTRLAALATLLDLLHKPGCRVRILGGSLEQSMKLWDYLLPDLHRLARSQLRRRLGASTRRLQFATGSDAAVLTQSQRAVRGLRVHKLRCDEVELFDPAVWEAAQLTTRSTSGITGSIEALSTLHRDGGLMGRIVDSAATGNTRLLRWCLLDVLARCEPQRPCDTCPLWDECRGRAKTQANGLVPVSDALRMKGRVSKETWDCEMLCRRPDTRGRVFPSFDVAEHVRPWDGTQKKMSLGVDFGFANPFVALWIATLPGGGWHVIDEHVQAGWVLERHLAEIGKRSWPRPTHIYCDPAGAARNAQTAQSDVAVLRKAGYKVRHRSSRIVDGLEQIRRALRPAAGPARLFVDGRCTNLIAALRSYRYPEGGGELPLKDGTHDHPIDALRYALLGLQAPPPLIVRVY